MDETVHIYDSEEDSASYPSWKGYARCFIDFQNKEAEIFNSLLETFMPDEVIMWDCIESSGWLFELEDAIIDVKNISFESTTVHITTATIPRTIVDPLRQTLREIISEVAHGCSVPTEFAIILLQLLEETASTLRQWKAGNEASASCWDIEGQWDVSALYKDPKGADLKSIDRSGEDILGTSITKICQKFPQKYRILHVEPVFRDDLVSRFKRRQRAMFEQLCSFGRDNLRRCVSSQVLSPRSALDNARGLASELCKPTVTFHGTQRHVVSSIVRWGFAKPGEKAGKETVQMRCGSSFGVGIYSSPDISFALHYASNQHTQTRSEDVPGLQMIVCATLMGCPLTVSRDDTRKTLDLATKDANSHVSPNGMEYVVFDKAQIIPCYVIHFDFGPEKARQALLEGPSNPADWKPKTTKTHKKLLERDLFPGEREEIKQAKKAAVSKWFPYGYGPAKGNSFVIEEIGDVSDDEEDYGEYQAERQDVKDESRTPKPVRVAGRSWFDEYQTSRGMSKEYF
ncbi:hypothetical protein BKA65DRAFT_566324 [Rhexocercosporidium sp. MPI-PUGE-AT-0058]|nr:hypothetical protein BKA65DRAFT_566324 [Rhexocercosporidium sp. MPI-PUGE-AT-0058]